MQKFQTGKLTMTRGVADKMYEDKHFGDFVNSSFARYVQCDWGEMDEEDKKTNDIAVKEGERILARYEAKDKTVIWIITEWDRSYTTILFPEEY